MADADVQFFRVVRGSLSAGALRVAILLKFFYNVLLLTLSMSIVKEISGTDGEEEDLIQPNLSIRALASWQFPSLKLAILDRLLKVEPRSRNFCVAFSKHEK